MVNTFEVKELCKKSLECAKIGTGKDELQNGIDFYKFMFTNYPALREYFKGAQHFTADDVQKSDRFKKQGQRLLVACHVLANCFDDPMTFKAYTRETINRHKHFKIDPALWTAFWAVFVQFLETKTSVDNQTKEAWNELGKVFADETKKHLKECGLPSA